MSDVPSTLPDGTLTFLPERLNRAPAVLRGLTNDEMWVALIVGAVLGLILGDPRAPGRRRAATIVGVVVALVVANFAWIYPILTDQLLPYSAWLARMWLHSWI